MTNPFASNQNAGAKEGYLPYRLTLLTLRPLPLSMRRSALLAGTAIALTALPLYPGSVQPARAGDFSITSLIIGHVYGNSTDPSDPRTNHDGDGSGNSITVENPGDVRGTTYGAYSSDDGTVLENNTISIDTTLMEGNIYGAWSDGTDTIVRNNSVTVLSGMMDQRIHGGYSENGNVENNSVTIDDGWTFEHIYGGFTIHGDAISNSVTINGGQIDSSVHGAQSDQSNTVGNSVTINGGTIYATVYGGVAYNGTASENSVTINDGIVNGYIYGALSDASDTTQNSVTITGGTVNREVYGAISISDDSTNNNVAITGGTIAGTVYGAASYGGGVATDNSVSLDGTVTLGTVYGGYDWGTGKDTFTGNRLTISSQTATITDLISNFQIINLAYIGALDTTTIDITPHGSTEAGTTFNTFANDVTVTGEIAGSGDLIKTGSGTLTLSGANSYTGATTIEEGTLASTVSSLSTTSDISVAEDATFQINGAGTLTKPLSGEGELVKAGSGTLTLDNGGTTIGSVSVQSGTLSLQSTLSTPELELYGGTTFTPNGYFTLDSTSTLNIRPTDTFAIWDGDLVTNGAAIYMPSTSANLLATDWTNPLLYVLGNADLTGSSVDVGVSGTASFTVGDEITLLTSSGTLTTTDIWQQDNIIDVGVTREYVIDLSADAATSSLIATITKERANKESKALPEGTAASAALINLASDVVAGDGLDEAQAATDRAGASVGSASFGVLSGGTSRYHTGSHVDVDGVSLMMGIAGDAFFSAGRLMLGAFGEYGRGTYETYNAIAGSTVLGKGSSHYYGGGILGRFDLAATALGHGYFEGSLRAGSMSNSYVATSGLSAEYDTKAAYYGMHMGAGYLWTLAPDTSLDVYGKYFLSQQGGDSVTLATGDSIEFDDVISRRVQAGARVSYNWSEQLTAYTGVAIEHEFDGEAKAFTSGVPIEAPSFEGNTGIGEIGVRFTPSKETPFALDLGIQGYVGKREGVTASLKARFEF